MVATCWSYFVPYEASVSAALSRLQADVFANGDFRSESGANFRSIGELRDAQAEEGTHSILDIQGVREEPAPPALSPEEKLMRVILGSAAEDGNHEEETHIFEETDGGVLIPTYLDPAKAARINAEISGYGLVFRMSDQELQACFSTTTPQRSMVEGNESKVCDLCETGTGRYAVVFAADPATPAFLFFAGVS
jgi:hypothetical protein